MISKRFEAQCAVKVPCVVYYVGKKQTKSEQQCFDVRFIRHDDRTVFHDSDEETEVDSFSSDALTALTPSVVSGQCAYCIADGTAYSCFGFCSLCGNHQPKNGSQCRCSIQWSCSFMLWILLALRQPPSKTWKSVSM